MKPTACTAGWRFAVENLATPRRPERQRHRSGRHRCALGVFAFGLTTRSVLAGATSITSSLGLMRAMRFPRALLPVSSVFGPLSVRLITFGFELGVLAIVAVITGEGLSRRLLALSIILVVHTHR